MMKIKKERYNTSKDYIKLIKLIGQEDIVCFVDFGDTKQVALATIIPTQHGGIYVKNTAYCFLYIMWGLGIDKTDELFVERCKELNLSYIIPENRAQMREKIVEKITSGLCEQTECEGGCGTSKCPAFLIASKWLKDEVGL